MINDTLEKIVADIKSQRAHTTLGGEQYISYYYMIEIKDRLEAIANTGEEVAVKMPLSLTKELIDAVQNDPLSSVDGKEEWHTRLGWLICAYDAMVKQRSGGHI